jgi:hypothetical protein
LLPQADVRIVFEILPQGRNVEIRGHTPTGRECVEQL